MWKQGQIKEVLSLCERNDGLKYFCKHFRNEGRGGVLGALLESTNPHLRQKKFPYLSYLLIKFPDIWKGMGPPQNPSMTWEVILFGMQIGRQIPGESVAKNPCVTPAIVKKHMAYFERLKPFLIRNPNFTLSDIQSLFGKGTFFVDIESVGKLTREFLDANVEKFDYERLSSNPSIGKHIDFVKNHLDKPWNWEDLTRQFSASVLKANADLPWNRNALKYKFDDIWNQNYTLDELKQKVVKQQDWTKYAAFSNRITWDDIRSNPELFNFNFWILLMKEDIDL
jgi:hypothetical protein